jgi:hypothetical protein
VAKRYPGDSVFDEPQFREEHFASDGSEATADRILRGHERDGEDDQAELTVWDEPGLSGELGVARKPEDLDYALWLKRGLAATTSWKSWRVTIIAALLAGPWAIVGAFIGAGRTGMSSMTILTVSLIGPVIEETMKMAIPFYIVEKRPFLFRSPSQIIICALAGGLAFAIIENLLYLNIYITDASLYLKIWRWTVCTALHMGCSFIVGLGVLRVWQDIWGRWGRAKLEDAFPMTAFAIGLHGVYNFLVVLAHAAGYRF